MQKQELLIAGGHVGAAVGKRAAELLEPALSAFCTAAGSEPTIVQWSLS